MPWRFCPLLHAVLLIVCSRIKIDNYFGGNRLITCRSYNTVARIFMPVSELFILFLFFFTYLQLLRIQAKHIKIKRKECRFIWYIKKIIKILDSALVRFVLQFDLFSQTVPFPGAGHIYRDPVEIIKILLDKSQ